MNAKEMFEELGYLEYTCYEKNDDRFGFQKHSDDWKEVRNIHFIPKHKTIMICGGNITQSISCFENDMLSIEEHLAIHQQMKELGWIE